MLGIEAGQRNKENGNDTTNGKFIHNEGIDREKCIFIKY